MRYINPSTNGFMPKKESWLHNSVPHPPPQTLSNTSTEETLKYLPPNSTPPDGHKKSSSRATRAAREAQSTKENPQTPRTSSPHTTYATSTTPHLKNVFKHSVSNVDTIANIAARYRVSIPELLKMNSLSSGADLWYKSYILIPLKRGEKKARWGVGVETSAGEGEGSGFQEELSAMITNAAESERVVALSRLTDLSERDVRSRLMMLENHGMKIELKELCAELSIIKESCVRHKIAFKEFLILLPFFDDDCKKVVGSLDEAAPSSEGEISFWKGVRALSNRTPTSQGYQRLM